MNMRTVATFLFFFICLGALEGTASRASQEGAERPLRNYFGLIEDVSHHLFAAEYIAIGSPTTTSNIPVFMKPATADADPRAHTTFLNLQDIQVIEVLPQPQGQELRFHNIEYATISIQFKNKATSLHHFLIEGRTKIWCEEVDSSVSIAKEIQVSALKRIEIKGVRSADIHQKNTPASKEAGTTIDKRKRRVCTRAATTVHELKGLVEKLPKPTHDAVQQQVTVLQDHLGELCSSPD